MSLRAVRGRRRVATARSDPVDDDGEAARGHEHQGDGQFGDGVVVDAGGVADPDPSGRAAAVSIES